MIIKESILRDLIRKKIRPLSESVIRVGENSITVEIADTDELTGRGLMFRESMDWDRGMLFVFPDSKQRMFWMKNTHIPLSIAYLNESGVILNIADMKPLDETRIPSLGPAKFALEVNKGWFNRCGIKPGDKVLIDL